MMAVVGRLAVSSAPRADAEPQAGHGDARCHHGREGRQGRVDRVPRREGGLIHGGVGKASFDDEALAQNIRAFVDAIVKAKPSGAKGTYVKKVSLSSTQGPSIRVDLASVQDAGAA